MHTHKIISLSVLALLLFAFIPALLQTVGTFRTEMSHFLREKSAAFSVVLVPLILFSLTAIFDQCLTTPIPRCTTYFTIS